jgi:hypothetical protein
VMGVIFGGIRGKSVEEAMVFVQNFEASIM